MKLPAQGAYYNAGVMLMNLDELRKQNFLGALPRVFGNLERTLSVLGPVGHQLSSLRPD